jgi:hypothetical protein
MLALADTLKKIRAKALELKSAPETRIEVGNGHIRHVKQLNSV